MRKTITVLLVLTLVAVVAVAPAAAGKKKKKGSFSASGPVPAIDLCPNDAQEGISKTTESLKIPFPGILTVTMTGFEGDWDLYVTDSEGGEIAAGTESQLTGAPPSEEVKVFLPKGYEVQMVACNWLGGLSAEVAWSLASPF